jgi:hypothetical protein
MVMEIPQGNKTALITADVVEEYQARRNSKLRSHQELSVQLRAATSRRSQLKLVLAALRFAQGERAFLDRWTTRVGGYLVIIAVCAGAVAVLCSACRAPMGLTLTAVTGVVILASWLNRWTLVPSDEILLPPFSVPMASTC